MVFSAFNVTPHTSWMKEKKFLTNRRRDGKIKILQPQGGTLKIEQHSKRIETTLEIQKEF